MRPRHAFRCDELFCVTSLVLVASPTHAAALYDAEVLLFVGPSPASPGEQACLPQNTGVTEDCVSQIPCDPITTSQSTIRYSLIVSVLGAEGVGGLSLGIEYSDNLAVTFACARTGSSSLIMHGPLRAVGTGSPGPHA